MAYLAEIREEAKPIKGKSYKKAPEKRSFPGLSERLSCKNVLDQRLLNWGARRAAFRPYFLRSLDRNPCICNGLRV
jgi:hypothetical protein